MTRRAGGANPNAAAIFVSTVCVLANARGFVEQHDQCQGAPAARCTCPCHRGDDLVGGSRREVEAPSRPDREAWLRRRFQGFGR